jgi:hypothetical protein
MSTTVSNWKPFNFNLGNGQKSGGAMFTVSYFHTIFAGIQHLEFSLIMQIVRKKVCKTVVIMDIIDTLFAFSSPATIYSHSTGGHFHLSAERVILHILCTFLKTLKPLKCLLRKV